MSRKANRRDPRVNVALDVHLQSAAGTDTYQTKNISYRGVFIVCDNPLPLRRLMRFRTTVEDGTQFEMMGLVAHRINVADATERGTRPGMGIQLYSLGADARERWVDHIKSLVANDPGMSDAVQHNSLPRLRLHIPDEEALSSFVENDLPSGEIFYRSPEPHPEGSSVVCEIEHPRTMDKFQFDASVIESISEGGRRARGMRVAFEPWDEEKSADFEAFRSGLNDEFSVPE